MGRFIGAFFRPPTMPEVALPLPARMIPGIRRVIAELYEKVYFAGVVHGVIFGLLAGVLLFALLRPRCGGER